MTDSGLARWQYEVDARLARLELEAEEAELADGGLGHRPSTPATGAGDYPTLDPWVRDYFCATFSRPLGGEFRWCSKWQEHPEAVLRLEALWCSWRALRRDPSLGLSTWLQQFLDPQLPILLSSRGPFRQCSVDRHERGNFL